MSAVKPSEAKGETSSNPGTGLTVPIIESFFPYKLEDLLYWVMRGKDGVLTRYTVYGKDVHTVGRSTYPPSLPAGAAASTSRTTHYSEYCTHNPTTKPVWDGDNYQLYIADTLGTKKHFQEFDFNIDCGNNIACSIEGKPMDGYNSGSLWGDKELVGQLDKYVDQPNLEPSRILKIDWEDRKAPPVQPQFWVDLDAMLNGTVLTSCQGGHGRSGTSLVCLMMVSNPEYTPKDAIIHLRAIHCPRAIESKVQHDYINTVGKYLGRAENAHEVEGVKDYKAEFLKLTLKSAKPYQDRLRTK